MRNSIAIFHMQINKSHISNSYQHPLEMTKILELYIEIKIFQKYNGEKKNYRSSIM